MAQAEQVWIKKNTQIKTQIWPVDEFQTARSFSIEMDYMWPAKHSLQIIQFHNSVSGPLLKQFGHPWFKGTSEWCPKLTIILTLKFVLLKLLSVFKFWFVNIVAQFLHRYGEMYQWLPSSPRDPLKWMGAVIMRVWTAHKNILSHTTLIHQLPSCEE